MNIRAPQNQGMVSPSNAPHGRDSTDTAHESTQKSITSDAPSVEQGCGAKLIRFPSGKNRDARRHRDPFSGNAVIVAISRVARAVTANPQQVFAARAHGKHEAENDKPQMLRKNLIFF